MIIKDNYQFSKSEVDFFSFFSSTNVETKNVCPIAYNGSRLGEVGDFENETLKLLLNLN
jgi:hypothetical protein